MFPSNKKVVIADRQSLRIEYDGECAVEVVTESENESYLSRQQRHHRNFHWGVELYSIPREGRTIEIDSGTYLVYLNDRSGTNEFQAFAVAADEPE